MELSAYDGDGTAVFESVSLQDGEITDHQEFNVIDLNEEVVFNKLIGVSISGEIKVKLESSGSFVIMDSSIDCSEITMNMNQIEMNISKGYTAYFMSENPIIATLRTVVFFLKMQLICMIMQRKCLQMPRWM